MKLISFFGLLALTFSFQSAAENLKNPYGGWGVRDLFRKTVREISLTATYESICVASNDQYFVLGFKKTEKAEGLALSENLTFLDFTGFEWKRNSLSGSELLKSYADLKQAYDFQKVQLSTRVKKVHKTITRDTRDMPADFVSLNIDYSLMNTESNPKDLVNDREQLAARSIYYPKPDGRMVNQLAVDSDVRADLAGSSDGTLSVVALIDKICDEQAGDDMKMTKTPSFKSPDTLKDIPLPLTKETFEVKS